MCFIVGLSFYWMRRQQYELFLVLHVLLSILVLLTMLGYVLSVSDFHGVLTMQTCVNIQRPVRCNVLDPGVHMDTRSAAPCMPRSRIQSQSMGYTRPRNLRPVVQHRPSDNPDKHECVHRSGRDALLPDGPGTSFLGEPSVYGSISVESHERCKDS